MPAIDLSTILSVLRNELRQLAGGYHPALAHARPDDVLATIVSGAYRAGLGADDLNRALLASGVELRGLATLRRVTLTPLALRSDGWVRLWANRLPRVLIAAGRGAVPYTAAGRKYTRTEVNEVVHWCVVAQCEANGLETTPANFLQLANWGLDQLYPEYQRRTGKVHPCQERVRDLLSHLNVQTWPL